MRHHYPLTWNAHEQFRPVRISFILGDVTRDAYMTTMERMERTFEFRREVGYVLELFVLCLLYTSPSPRDGLLSRMPSSA